MNLHHRHHFLMLPRFSSQRMHILSIAQREDYNPCRNFSLLEWIPGQDNFCNCLLYYHSSELHAICMHETCIHVQYNMLTSYLPCKNFQLEALNCCLLPLHYHYSYDDHQN